MLVLQLTYEAFCQLRTEVTNVLLTLECLEGPEFDEDEYQARQLPDIHNTQQHIDILVESFAAAYLQEVGVVTPMRKGVGVIEPTGSGKTGMINLTPYAAFTGAAPTQCNSKVLIVVPNIAIRQGMMDSFRKGVGRSCLADIMKVMPHSELPTAFDLSRLSQSWGRRGGRPNHHDTSDDDSDDEDGDAPEAPGNRVNHDPRISTDGGNGIPIGDLTTGNRAPESYANISLMGQLAAADIVIANVQQLKLQKLELLFPRTYFGLVIVDEAHHVAAHTYKTVLEYFSPSAKVWFTATPWRTDGQYLPMYILDYANPTADHSSEHFDMRLKLRIEQGYCRNVAYAPVPIFSAKLLDRNERDNVLNLQGWEECEKSSFHKDIQEATRLNPGARAATVRHSLRLMEWLRQTSGKTHTILAQAHDTDDANALIEEWKSIITKDFRDLYSVGLTHSELPEDEQACAKRQTKKGRLDVIVHVGQLSEGFDAPALSIIAMFTVFRSILRFNQTIGRATRRMQGLPKNSPANVAFVVAHPLLGYSRQWTIYTEERQERPGELKSTTLWAIQRNEEGPYEDTTPILSCKYTDAPISWMGLTRLSRVPELLALIHYKISDFYYLVPPATLNAAAAQQQADNNGRGVFEFGGMIAALHQVAAENGL